MAIITISRQAGSLGHRIAREVSVHLNYPYFDKRVMAKVIAKLTTSSAQIDSLFGDNISFSHFMDQLILEGKRLSPGRTLLTVCEQRIITYLDEERALPFVRRCIVELKNREKAVIVGRGSQVILKDHPHAVHIRIFAPKNVRTERVAKWEKVSKTKAWDLIQERDKLSSRYIKRFYGVNWDDLALYHLIINTSKWDIKTATQIIIEAVKIFG